MKLKLATVAFTFLALTSCKKNDDDPTPSDQGITHYRVTKVDEISTDVHDVWTYTYNADGRLQEEVRRDKNDAQTYRGTFQYNTKGFVSFATQQGTSYQSAVSFTYTSDDLVDTRISYSDMAGTTPSVTTVYHYFPNKDLKYSIATQIVGGDAYIDSVVYTNYTNGRPSIKRRFYKSTGSYVLQTKQLFTYDARMNLIKKQATESSSDSTIFIDYATGAFTVLGDKQAAAWNEIGFASNNYIYSDNNISPGNADVNKDYQSEEANLYSCGINSKYTNSIIIENTSGYPLKIRRIQDSYNCGTLLGSTSSDSDVTYEEY